MSPGGLSYPVVQQRLFAYSGGFFRNPTLRRILSLAGYDLKVGLPGRGRDPVAIWGRTPIAWRGLKVAAWRQAPLISVEDAFLRSVQTGRAGAEPHGLVIDKTGIYFDCTAPSDLENILNQARLDDPALVVRAKAGIERLRAAGVSKYNNFDKTLAPDARGYVLVIDQTRGDASIRLGGASADSFKQMLAAARAEHPEKQILIKTHPEVSARYRRGHFGRTDLDARTQLLIAPMSPAALFDGAAEVYCVSSLMGFEAILAGHRPNVFGKPFYGGWGLSDDRQKFDRRQRPLSREALFAGAMLIYPTWYDPYRDALCDFETVVDNLEAQARAWQEDCHGYAALGIRLWKRRHFRRFFAGAGQALSFEDEVEKAARSGRPGLVWASKETAHLRERFTAAAQPLFRVEDGFLRSRGLGAELVPPMSLVRDDLGIYFDPRNESRLEHLLLSAADLPASGLARAAHLREQLIKAGVSKYNTGNRDFAADWPKDRHKILVPGQVEDDASILTGAAEVRTNLHLVRETRAQNPEAFIIYKPHPDIEAGLRKGRINRPDLDGLADVILDDADPIAAINAVDAVWTMTSLLGFEALLRDRPVTCLGTPFYAGWGLTRDLGPATGRRGLTLSLDALIHATLIAYPRYFDPVTGLACPVEVVVDRLASGTPFHGTRRTRLLAKLQGVLATYTPFWR